MIGRMIVLAALFVILFLVGTYVAGLATFLSFMRERWSRWGNSARLLATVGLPLLILSPYLGYRGLELRHALERVPDPLHAMWIDYRVEKSSGFGLPSDNETGFLVYRLTPASARWAKAQSASLSKKLSHGRGGEWKPTPIVDEGSGTSRWHGAREPKPINHGLDVRDYLGRYGYGIDVEKGRIDEANRLIRRSGSFYQYGRGGRLTVVAPRDGQVIVAYAG